MSKLIRVMLILALALAFSTPVFAQGTGVQHSDPTWQAYYWNNTALTGPDPDHHDTDIDFDWGSGAPTGINADNFSARWTRYLALSRAPTASAPPATTASACGWKRRWSSTSGTTIRPRLSRATWRSPPATTW